MSLEWSERWPHFKPEEVLSPESRPWDICPCTLDKLEQLRALVGVGLLVNHGELRFRGARTQTENAQIEGAVPGSFHIKGRAIDVTPVGLSIDELLDVVLVHKVFTGIGVYSTFLHLDTRYIPENKPPVVWYD